MKFVKEWSKKARELRDDYIDKDDKLEEFKIELQKLSDLYYAINNTKS